MRPSVVLISGDYLPNIGGLAGHVHELGQALFELGHKVSILTSVPAEVGYTRDDVDKNIFVHRIPPRFSQRRWMARGQIIHHTIRHIADLQRDGRADIVHWHTLDHFCPAMAKLKHSAKVFTNHTSHFTAALARGRHRRLKRQIGHADAWITPSHVLYEGTCALGFDESRIHLISNGVNERQFQPGDQSAARVKLGLDHDAKIVLYAGRVAQVKGTDILLDAIELLDAQLPENIQFVIVGDHARDIISPFESQIDSKSKDLIAKNRLIFLGPKSREEMVFAYQSADLVVLPSRNEGMSLTGLEAMATGLPLIASAVGGILQITKPDHDACLVPAENAGALAEAIRAILDDAELANRLGVNARNKVIRDWTWKQVARQTAEVYEQVLINSDQ